MRLALLASCALLVLAASSVAEERVEIRIEGAGGRDLQVAVQRFDADPASQPDVDEFYEELTGALEFGGSLIITPPAAFLGPERTGDFSNDGRYFFVNCNRRDEVVVVDGNTQTQVASVAVGISPAGVVVR